MKLKDILQRENIDLHVHTKYSEDCFLDPKKIVRFAEKYDRLIAITDHNEIQGALEAKKYDRENRIIVGEEILASDIGAEILALGIRKKIEPGPAADIIREIHGQGGAAVLSHPFRRGYLRRKKIPAFPDEIIEALDGVEVWNARNSRGENQKAQKFAQKHGKQKTRGSDAHMLWELYLADKNSTGLNLLKNLLTFLTRQLKKIRFYSCARTS